MTTLRRTARPLTILAVMTLAMLAGQLAGCAPVVQAKSKGATTYYEGPVKSRYAARSTRR